MAMPPSPYQFTRFNNFSSRSTDLTPDGLKGLAALTKSQFIGGHSATVPGASSVPGARAGVPNGPLSNPDETLRAIAALSDENQALRAWLEDVKNAQTLEGVQAIADSVAKKYVSLQNAREMESAERRAQQKPRRREDILQQIQSREETRASESECLRRRIAEVNALFDREKLRTAAAEQRIKTMIEEDEAGKLEEKIRLTGEEANDKVRICFSTTSRATEEYLKSRSSPGENQVPDFHDGPDLGSGETWRHRASPRRNHSALSFDKQRIGLYA